MDVLHSLSTGDSRKTLTKDLGSENVCGANPVCGDSESRPDSFWRFGGRRAVGARFWAKVNREGPIPAHVARLGPCWLWTASTIRGYGQFKVYDNRHQPVESYAHRASWWLAHGEPPTACVLHHCDNPLCVRPSHLFLGSRQDNLDDARHKGRLDESRPRTHVLTPADRLAIYQMRGYRGICLDLARQYGVTKACISHIRKGRFAGSPRRDPLAPVFGRVPSVSLPIRGELHLSSMELGQ